VLALVAVKTGTEFALGTDIDKEFDPHRARESEEQSRGAEPEADACAWVGTRGNPDTRAV